MIDIAHEISNALIVESMKSKRIFNDDSLTFKQLKDIFTNAFNTNIVSVSRKVPMTSLYITNHDGEFFISAVDQPEKLLKVKSASKAVKLDECDCKPVDTTVAAVADALQKIDPVLLNRCFANGSNKLKLRLVCPPAGCSDLYGGKCFLQVDGIDCFDSDGKSIGQDKESSFELFKALKSNGCECAQDCTLDAEKLSALNRCRSEKRVLKNILDALAKLVDGIGWGCSIKYYIHDRYARSIVNKALEHNLDVSKNGAFVDELASRLSGTSPSRPTKSDLVTFAKREGIDCKSQDYKDFLDDIESTAEQTSNEIISPVENVIYYGISNAANNVIALMALDPNPKAQKLLSSIASSLFSTCESVNECGFDCETAYSMKKALQKLCSYKDMAPAEIRVMNGGKPYSVKGDITKLQRLCEVVG